MNTPYWARLDSQSLALKGEVDRALARFEVKPVGTGYIDIIVVPQKAEAFLTHMTQLGIAASMVTLWCEASEANKAQFGCPHGMGGPIRDGIWFSEMGEGDLLVSDVAVDVQTSLLDPFALAGECNDVCLRYTTEGIPALANYSPCMVPGFWLAVPKDWRSLAAADESGLNPVAAC